MHLLGFIIRIKSHVTVLLADVSYGCETWPLTLREEQRLRVCQNRVLGTIFRPKEEEVTGGWRRLNNEDFRDSYSSSNVLRLIKSRMMKCERRVACKGENRNI